MNVKLQKVVLTDKSFDWTDTKGKTHKSTFYKLVLESGYSIIFKPTNSNDYPVLDAVAEKIYIDTVKGAKNENNNK